MDKWNVLTVGTVYRPPNSNIVDFNNTMSNILEKLAIFLVISWVTKT